MTAHPCKTSNVEVIIDFYSARCGEEKGNQLPCLCAEDHGAICENVGQRSLLRKVWKTGTKNDWLVAKHEVILPLIQGV